MEEDEIPEHVGISSVAKNVGGYVDNELYKLATQYAEEAGLERVEELDGKEMPEGVAMYHLDGEEYVLVDNRDFRGIEVKQLSNPEARDEVNNLSIARDNFPTVAGEVADIEADEILYTERIERSNRAQEFIDEIKEAL